MRDTFLYRLIDHGILLSIFLYWWPPPYFWSLCWSFPAASWSPRRYKVIHGSYGALLLCLLLVGVLSSLCIITETIFNKESIVFWFVWSFYSSLLHISVVFVHDLREWVKGSFHFVLFLILPFLLAFSLCFRAWPIKTRVKGSVLVLFLPLSCIFGIPFAQTLCSKTCLCFVRNRSVCRSLICKWSDVSDQELCISQISGGITNLCKWSHLTNLPKLKWFPFMWWIWFPIMECSVMNQLFVLGWNALSSN